MSLIIIKLLTLTCSADQLFLTSDNVLDYSECRIDFTPLYLAIHIYETLDASEELRKSFRDDRRAQAHLIISSTATSPFSLDSICNLMESIVGFFIIESHVIHTTKSFRDETDVDTLWDEVCEKVMSIISDGVGDCEDLDLFLNVKTRLLNFSQTLAVSPHPSLYLSHQEILNAIFIFLRPTTTLPLNSIHCLLHSSSVTQIYCNGSTELTLSKSSLMTTINP